MKQQVMIIEDDDALANSLSVLLDSAGITDVSRFESPTRFLLEYPNLSQNMHQPGCLLMDIRLPEMSGAALYAHLQSLEFHWPVIFMTGHGDLSMAVDLMKAGAFDYVTKPFDPMGLIERIKAANMLSRTQLIDHEFKQAHMGKLASLTQHEIQVFTRILLNQTTREIAEAMDNSTRTIETHRANLLKKMDASSALEMAQEQERFVRLGGLPPFPMTPSDTQ